MLTNETLRFIDEVTFQEANAPEDRSRPLEWRRSFNTVAFTADNPRIEHIYSVNDIDHFAALRHASPGSGDEQASPVVTPSGQRLLRIICPVSQDKLRDSIFCTKEMEKGSALYQLRRPKGAIQVTLTDAPPTDQRGLFAAGAYAGLAFETDFQPGEDGLCVEVSVPTQHLAEVASAFRGGEANTLHVAVAIQSFSYEVDDALREWYHPRDLFVHGSAVPAALSSLRVVRREPEPASSSAETDEDALETEQSAPPAPPPALQTPDFSYERVLKGIKAALWAIAVVLLLHLFR